MKNWPWNGGLETGPGGQAVAVVQVRDDAVWTEVHVVEMGRIEQIWNMVPGDRIDLKNGLEIEWADDDNI